MSADAIVVFHPKDPAKLAPFLDLDENSEDSEGLYAETLEDGTTLVHTFQPFEVFAQNPDEADEWLAQFGEALPDVHDDPRGVLFYPDTCEPTATTYDALVAEIADQGFFHGGELDVGGIDLGALEALAGQLLAGHPGEGTPMGSFDIGQMVETMQKHLAGALGQPQDGAPSPIVDEEFDDDEPPKKEGSES